MSDHGEVRRPGIWLYPYDRVKYKTRMEWFGTLVLGFGALVFGPLIGWVFWETSKPTGIADAILVLLFPAASFAFGILDFPAALIYFHRKAHGIPADIWEFEELEKSVGRILTPTD